MTKETKTKVVETNNAQLQPLEVQEVNKIVPVRPDFLSDKEDNKLKKQAESIANDILKDPTNTEITVQVYNLGSEFMSANTTSVSLMDTKVSLVMKEIQTGSPVNKSLTQIKTQLDLINPSVVAQTETSFPSKVLFGLLSRTLSRLPKGDEILNLINERKDTVGTTIEGLKRHLLEEKDKALKNAIELGQISNKLFETQQDLQEAVYVGQIVWEKLGSAASSETKPVKKQALTNLINDLAVQVVDIQTVDTLNVQSRLSAEALINNSRKIEQGVKRVVNILLPSVATNLMVKAAAAQQAALVGTMSDITRAAEQTMVDTAKQTKQASIQMEKMQSESLINPEALQKAADEVIEMIEEIEKIQIETESKARATSKALSYTSNTMRKYADPMTNARHALEKVKS